MLIILEKAQKTVEAIVMDQDGTVKGGDDPAYKKADVAELLKKIAKANHYPIVITASGASALKSFSSLIEFYKQEKKVKPAYVSIGNGTALYRFDKRGKSEIYNLGLSLDEVRKIVEVWKKVYGDLNIKETDLKVKGLETFRKFMTTDWTGYIPEKYLAVFRQYDGRCFTEEIKVTVVFPDWDDEKQRSLVKKLQNELDKTLGKKKYLAVRGDDTFMHIIHTFKIDPKLYTLKKIMAKLKLKKTNVAVFGDMPFDNDRGMMVDSKLPYTFTNKPYKELKVDKPPYLLPGSSESAVGSVYNAINSLIR